MNRKLIASLLVTSLLALSIFFIFHKSEPLEGDYTSTDLNCSCDHRGIISFKNNKIEMIHRRHDSKAEVIGSYEKISQNDYKIDIDWRYIKSSQVVTISPDKGIKVKLFDNITTNLTEHPFSVIEYVQDLNFRLSGKL